MKLGCRLLLLLLLLLFRDRRRKRERAGRSPSRAEPAGLICI